MSVEAYSIAVRISLINSVSAGLLSMSQHFAKVHGDADALQKKLEGIRLTMMKGAALVAVGGFGLDMISKTIKPASEYVHQLEAMNVAGMKHAEIIKATNAAWAAQKDVPTSDVSENLSAIRELRMVFGETNEAIANVSTVQKLQAILQGVKGGEGGGKDEAYEVAKALELKGAVKNPEMFTAQADAMAKAIVASGGKVGASDFLSAFKYGRSATNGWNEDFTYKILPTLIQEMKSAGGSGGAGGPGNALMSMYAAVVNGTLSQKSLGEWTKLGLLDPKKIVYDKVGSAKGVLPGGVTGSDLFQSNPYAWAQTILRPALERSGATTDKQQQAIIGYLFQNRTAGFMAQQMTTQGWKFDRDRKLIDSAQGLSAYEDLMKNDPAMGRIALEKQWQSLLAILGFQIMPEVIKGTLWLVNVLQKMGAFFREHATAAKILMFGLAGLSTLMVAGGAVYMIVGTFKALGVAMEFTGIGGAPGIVKLAGALRMAGGALGSLFAIAAAGAAGYALGTVASGLLDKAIQSGTHGRSLSLGDRLYDMTHRDTSAETMMTPGRGSQKVQVTTNLHVDGKQMASVVDQHFGKLFNSGASQGTTQPDFNYSVPPIAAQSGSK